MASYQAWANYTVFFTDPTLYNFAVAVFGNTYAEISPVDAASMFGLTFPQPAGPLGDSGFIFYAPYTPNAEIRFPNPTGTFLLPNVLTRVVTSNSTTPGPDMVLTWSCSLLLIAAVDNDPLLTAPIPQRRWITGFESRGGAEGGQSAPVSGIDRDASRVTGGVGWALRNPLNVNMTRRLDEYQPGLITGKSHERFYIRVRTFGLINLDIWKSTGLPSPSAGAWLSVTPTGALLIENVTAFSVHTTLATVPGIIQANVWHKIDVIVEYNTLGVGGSGRMRTWVDNLFVQDTFVAAGSGGLGANSQNHDTSIIGTQTGTPNTWEIDLDDWINTDIPRIGGVESLTSIDWLVGSHVKKVWVNAGSVINWTGNVQSMNQMMNPISTTTGSRLTSTTGLAQLIGLTDLDDTIQDTVGAVLGCVSAIISVYGVLASGAIAGRMGYKVAGGAPVMVSTLVEDVIARYNSIMYIGNGVDIFPSLMAPFSIIYEKANNAVSTVLYGLQAEIEQIGVWGDEDFTDTPPAVNPRFLLNHNAWYPDIAWAFPGPTPDGPIAVKGGVYAGNGTTQDIPLPLPCHFLWIIGDTGGAGGCKWFGGALGGHPHAEGQVQPDTVLRVYFDILTGNTFFRVVGTNADVNAVGVNYQYIAFCDPGMQYNITGSYTHAGGLATAFNPFPDLDFTPLAAFWSFEYLSSDASVRTAFKGPGNTGAAGNLMDGTAQPTLGSLVTGGIVSGPNSHFAGIPANYSVWRTGNSCATVMAQIFSYIGDGNASRVIPCTPAAGRYPLFVYVQPSTGGGLCKSPSDPGAVSRSVTNNASSVVGIMSVGIDTITVGVGLNVNLTVYNVFIIPGSTAGFLNGTFQPGNCSPEWIDVLDPEPPLPGVNVFGNGGLELGDGSVPITLLKNVSGIYTMVLGKTNDTLYDRQTGQPNVDVKIPDPIFKTGYLGG
jgi:hypothetical protein